MSYGHKGPSPKQREAIKHNGLIGLSVAMQKNAGTIADSSTATERAKSLAREIYTSACALEQALRAERKS